MTMNDSNDDSPRLSGVWPRRGCISITLPDPDEDGGRFTEVTSLGPLIRKVLDRENSVNRIEILSWPGKHQQEWILCPESETATQVTDDDESRGQVRENHALEEFGLKPAAEREQRSSITGALRAVLESSDSDDDSQYEGLLPRRLGYNLCDVDFGPIEGTLRPTCRLVAGKNPDLHPLRRKQPSPIADLITDLNKDDVFYILQTIVSIGHKTVDYELSQRLAVYPPEYGLGVEKDFLDLMKYGPPVNLSDYYDPYVSDIQSNFDLDGHDFFRVDGTGPEATVVPRDTRGEAAAERARRILEGKHECHRLYAGYHSTNQDLQSLYQHRDYYTKLPVNGAGLDAFLDFVPAYIKYPPSEAVTYVDPPKLIERPERLPGDTASAKPTTTQATPDAESASPVPNVTRGSKEHQFSEDSVAQYYRDRGYTVIQPDTETDGSVPDLIISKDGMTYFVEVEETGQSRPANVLTNAARAVYYDVPVYFVTKDNSTARTVAKMLRHPVRENTKTGARLYTLSRALSLPDGRWPLLPPDVNESIWHLDNTQTAPEEPATLELRDSTGNVVASGPVTESVQTFDYDTKIISAGADVPQGRTRVHPPFVPTKLAYLRDSSIRYQRGNNDLAQFERGDYRPGWDYTDNEGKRKRYKAAFRQFIQDKTITVDGAEIQKHDAISTLLEELYTPQTTRKAPGVKEASRALWQVADKKQRNDEENSGKLDLIQNRRWRWPLTTTPPDLPFVDNTPDEFDIESHL